MNGDELAGVAEQFGALTRAELVRASEEVAFRRGESFDEEAAAAAVERAERRLHLVAVDDGDGEVLAAGPAALPALPEGAENLPHVLDAPERSVPRPALVEAAERRLREAAARAVADDDPERVADLLDATYDLEAWGGDVDADDVRARLDDALE